MRGEPGSASPMTRGGQPMPYVQPPPGHPTHTPDGRPIIYYHPG